MICMKILYNTHVEIEMNGIVGFEPSQNGFSASLLTELSMLSTNGFQNSQA